jgi:hypothetical protein
MLSKNILETLMEHHFFCAISQQSSCNLDGDDIGDAIV